MRVFIPKGSQHFISSEILNENCYAAFYGFSMMGWEVVFYNSKEGVPENLSRGDVVVGFIHHVKKAVRNLGIEPPTEIDYPEELSSYYGRKLWKSTLHKVYADPETWPVFVKPVLGKQFDGKLIKGTGDLVGLGSQEDREIWCSEPVNFISEYRCFIKYGNLVDAKRYKGSFKITPDFSVVERCIQDFKAAPAAYSLDFGVTSDGRSLLVEVNDGYSMGSYGLHHLDYAKFVSARWHEMVGIPDPCRF
jgi:hypothetical protein